MASRSPTFALRVQHAAPSMFSPCSSRCAAISSTTTTPCSTGAGATIISSAFRLSDLRHRGLDAWHHRLWRALGKSIATRRGSALDMKVLINDVADVPNKVDVRHASSGDRMSSPPAICPLTPQTKNIDLDQRACVDEEDGPPSINTARAWNHRRAGARGRGCAHGVIAGAGMDVLDRRAAQERQWCCLTPTIPNLYVTPRSGLGVQRGDQRSLSRSADATMSTLSSPAPAQYRHGPETRAVRCGKCKERKAIAITRAGVRLVVIQNGSPFVAARLVRPLGLPGF